MDKPSFKLVGTPCGHHGQYTFYKALKVCGQREKIIAIGDFFFVKIWPDSELVSVGELQLLWTDRVSDQTLVSLRLYFLPENTPDGRGAHGEDEVLAINEKVVLRAEDLMSWVCTGEEWRWGLRAVWRGACAPPSDSKQTAPLHHTKLDFSDVEKEKGTIAEDESSPGVVVFSYPRYCRYRALVSRLEGSQADWLRESLVAALGGYAAPTHNTRILYCKDTFEYPELEGHEFVCNHLAPKMKGRPRGRRRRRARSRSQSRSSRSSESDGGKKPEVTTPRRPSLRNGKTSDDEEEELEKTPKKDPDEEAEDKAFLKELKAFYKSRNESFKVVQSIKDVSLRALYMRVRALGGYGAVCRARAWKTLPSTRPHTRARLLYERFLLPYENHERRNGTKVYDIENGQEPIDTIEVADSPLRETKDQKETPEKRLRTPSPKPEHNFDPSNLLGLLNTETEAKMDDKKETLQIKVKPVEKLIDSNERRHLADYLKNSELIKSLAEDNSAMIAELASKYNVSDSRKIFEELSSKQGLSEWSSMFLNELTQKLNLGHPDSTFLADMNRQTKPPISNGHQVEENVNSDQKNAVRPVGRSSLRSVRVKPAREARLHATPHLQTHNHTPPMPPLRPDSASSSPPITSSTPATNFGINYPQPNNQVTTNDNQETQSDDEIVEVPYKPKTPEIIDLDEYPESPQAIKKKKLDMLKERGLEVTAIPNTQKWPQNIPQVVPTLVPTAPMLLNPAMQHQIMTQAQILQMYNIIPNYNTNGVQPPKVIQAKSIFGSSGPEKTVYGNPKDQFMPPPHFLQGTPIKPKRNIQTSTPTPQDILDLTCKSTSPIPIQKPAVEIVRVPSVPSPSKIAPQNLSKNYTLADGKAIVGSNLEITLVNPKTQPQTPIKSRPSQKRSSDGRFVGAKTPTPPKPYPSPSGAQNTQKDRKGIVVPNYQIPRDEPSPTGSSSSKESQSNLQSNILNAYKSQNLAQIMEMQAKNQIMTPFMDPLYMSAIYSSLAGQMDQRQLALYRDFMTSQFRNCSGVLNMGLGPTPTTKN